MIYTSAIHPDPTIAIMQIDPTKQSLTQLFDSPNEQFRIPAYQRRYSWEKKHLAALFNDVYNLPDGENHLLGTLLCLTVSHKAGINALEIVDGQQRLTSLSIFLKVLQNRYEDLKDQEKVGDIKRLLTCGNPTRSKRKLILGDLDDKDYMRVLKQENLDEVENKNLIGAYNYFTESVASLSDKKVQSLYWKLTTQVFIIRLDASNVKAAYTLFETINNRGLPLTSTDIIKNFLLGHASTIDEDTLNKVRDNWSDLIIALDGINTDNFFRIHMMRIKKEKVTKKDLVDIFKKYYCGSVKGAETLPEYSGGSHSKSIENGEETAVEFSERLKRSALVYREICKEESDDDDINQHLRNLHCMQAAQTHILLLPAFQRNPKLEKREMIRLLKILEALMLRRNTCKLRANELEKLFPKLVEIIESDNMVANIQKRLRECFPPDDEFQKKFPTARFSREAAKYVLGRIECDLRQDPGEFGILKEVHLEHIIPKTIRTSKSKKEFGDWVSYLGKESRRHTDHVHLIGNLTLIASKLNIAASNNPFARKKKEYRKSAFELNREISEYKRFDYKAVRGRSELLAERAVKIWTLDGT